ncbi:MAG: T9SS type A sorting domain-containing protein [Spirochaetia bacterium]|nr:T9SS type A sorting domain-containing protein [Spirochaetia bacterium]
MKTRKIFLMLFFCLSPFHSLFSAATSVTVEPFGYSGQYLEATLKDNPVLHISINAPGGDVLTQAGVKNTLDSWYAGAADEPSSIAQHGVKLWYMAVDSPEFDTFSAVYVTTLVSSGVNTWDNVFSLAVADGSGLWITVDIADSPVFGTIEMQTDSLVFANAPGVSSSDEPGVPPVLLVTDITPAGELLVSHVPGSMQPFVSTGQSNNVIPCDIIFYNNSPQSSADINVRNLTITVEAYPSPGAVLAPASILATIKITDKEQGTKYGEITHALMPGGAVPLNIPLSLLDVPAGVTVQANVIITLADTAPPAADFVLSLDSAPCVNAVDSYTMKPVSVSASSADPTGFPMYSNFSKLVSACNSINSYYYLTGPDPRYINKGATNVELISIYLENPGNSTSASAELYNLKLHITDNNNAPIIPKDLFSRIALTDSSGTVKYRVKLSDNIESSGNAVTFSLSNTAIIPAASGVTVVVSADISISTVVNNFRVSVNSASDINCRDKNSLYAAAVNPAVSMPYVSPLALLSSSFLVSVNPLMAPNIYTGQQNIHAMDITLSSPLSFGNGNILIKGLTLTARDSSGGAVDFAATVSTLKIACAGVTSVVSSPSGSRIYMAFPSPVTIPAMPLTSTISVYLDVLPDPSSSSCRISLDSGSIFAFQDNDPARDVFGNAASGYSFPMFSGNGVLAGTSDSLSFSTYPNPFKKGSYARLAYYLDASSDITIKIYDLSGRFIKTVIDSVQKNPGSHDEDTWDGSDSSGRSIIAGTYLVKIEKTGSAKTETIVRKITYIK